MMDSRPVSSVRTTVSRPRKDYFYLQIQQKEKNGSLGVSICLDRVSIETLDRDKKKLILKKADLDDRRIYGWNLKYTISLDNHCKKVREHQPPKKMTTSTWTKTTSTSNRPSPLHPATTSTTNKQLMTTPKIFQSTETPLTWRSLSNTKQRKDKQSTLKNQREANPRSHKIEKRSPLTTSKNNHSTTLNFFILAVLTKKPLTQATKTKKKKKKFTLLHLFPAINGTI
jgi:hypothetical protein